LADPALQCRTTPSLTTLQADALRTQVGAILEAAGNAPAEAAQVAANLVLANLSGHDSHGVGMVPRYVDAIAEGGLKPNTSVAVRLDTGTLLALDGQRGYGQIVGVQAIELGIARAKQHGSCIVMPRADRARSARVATRTDGHAMALCLLR